MARMVVQLWQSYVTCVRACVAVYQLQNDCGAVRIVFYFVTHERLFEFHVLAFPGRISLDINPPKSHYTCIVT